VAEEQRRLQELSPQESMRLLGSISIGRIVFTARALPAILPVTHLVDGDYVIIRTDASAAITSELRAEAGTIVAYEADTIDLTEHLGWSVIVVGVAHRVIDPDDAGVYRRALRPWVNGAKDEVIAIHADLVTGFRLVPDRADGAARASRAAAGNQLDQHG
jgi:pyridoxamine 5'-phosphate oxidase-like protein